MLSRAAELASVLKDRYAAERLEAQLLAGRMARQVGLTELATQQFQAASAQRRKGSALRRSAAWLATAQLADMRGDRAGMLRACERGLSVLDTHALSLGATELRARATTHGVELVRTAIGRVIEDGSGRDLLRWTERWRSTLHATTTRHARQTPRSPRSWASYGRQRARSGEWSTPTAMRTAAASRSESGGSRMAAPATATAPGGADELLGLASSLTALGTAGLLASVVPVNDEATVPFSLAVHERLRAGDDLASSLLAARRAADDPVARATAWSFLALGGA